MRMAHAMAVILLIWVSLALGVGQVGGAGRWGVCWVINCSLYEFRNVQRERISKQNRIISISSGLIEVWCFGLPVALGKGRCLGGCLGASEGMGVSPHACTCIHTQPHACMHMYACIEIANGCQHGGIHVYCV